MRHSELFVAALIVAGVTAAYVAYSALAGVPAAGTLVGHLMGVVGFTLMLLTETLYSLRKRAMKRPRGSMRTWLQIHIVMGIVGPYLVLLHSAWTFNGLAGALTVMTALVAGSGFIGRYIYTAVPRTADGVIIEAQELSAQLTALREAAATDAVAMAAPAAGGGASATMLAAEAGAAATMTATLPVSPDARREHRALEGRIRQLERQISALRWERRVLATWHAIHIPMGMAMFVVGFTHVAAALYYSTLLR